jgi:hypothetical protein
LEDSWSLELKNRIDNQKWLTSRHALLELGSRSAGKVGWAEGGDGLAMCPRTMCARPAQGGLGRGQVVADEKLPMAALSDVHSDAGSRERKMGEGGLPALSEEVARAETGECGNSRR